jgi:hypothetical protein
MGSALSRAEIVMSWAAMESSSAARSHGRLPACAAGAGALAAPPAGETGAAGGHPYQL